jgi:hypothetical protein
MVEGCGQLNSSLSWGDGFAADLDAAALADGETSAAPFFDTLLDPAAPKPYRYNVILGPHVLPTPFLNPIAQHQLCASLSRALSACFVMFAARVQGWKVRCIAGVSCEHKLRVCGRDGSV